MFVRKAALFAALSSFALFSTTAHAREGCWYPNEIKAAQLVDVQTKLMVGTLHCRLKTPSVLDHYNTFSTNQRDLLEANHMILRARFAREESAGKSGGQHTYDRHLSSVANYYSGTAPRGEDSDCSGVASLARVAAELSHEQLLMLAASIAKAPNSGPCPPSHYSFGDDGAPGATLQAKAEQPQSWQTMKQSLQAPERAAAALEPKSEQVMLASQPQVQPAVETAAAPPESGKSEASVTPAQTSQASSANGLQEAVVALRAATAALEAAVAKQNAM